MKLKLHLENIVSKTVKKVFLMTAFFGLSSSCVLAIDSTFVDLNASGVHYTFFSLANNDTVPLADSATTNWDLAFKGTTIILNGGISGPGSTVGQVITEAYTSLTIAPGDGYTADSSTSKAIPTGSGNGWYTYVGPSTHIIEPITGRTIVVQTTSGDFYKLEMVSYYQGNPDLSVYTTSPPVEPSKYYTFKFNKLNGTALSTDSTFADLNATGSHYTFFSLVNNDTVSLADSATTNWDLAFKGTTIILNGGISGPGSTVGQVVPNSYTTLTNAPSSGYSADAASGKAIPTGSGNGWYTYAGPPTHKIEPILGRTIVVQITNGDYYKIEIISYYEGNPDLSVYTMFPPAESSKYYTFKFTKLTNPTTGIAEHFTVHPLNIYPNPATGGSVVLTNDFQTMGNSALLTVTSLNGQVVVNQNLNLQSTRYKLNTGELRPGIYLVAVQTAGQLYRQKLVIQ